MTVMRFGPACAGEQTAFGAARPGYPAERVATKTVIEWLHAVRSEGIKAVICLLDRRQIAYYGQRPGLLSLYRDAFGPDGVLHTPVRDYHLCAASRLQNILGFMKTADDKRQRVVLHCSGGLGRTGHVLAAWLVYARGLAEDAAIEAVVTAGRNPKESIDAGNATASDLASLLRQCRVWRSDLNADAGGFP
jgi:protein-tyrosine phosphatase